MKQKGFTLIELLVVVAIIGILAAVGWLLIVGIRAQQNNKYHGRGILTNADGEILKGIFKDGELIDKE